MQESTADVRELQACACLQAAEFHREKLLAVARKLAGSDEAGRELFQQTVLNCHDAIQRWGFAGDRYEFYLLKSLKQPHRHQRAYARLRRPLTQAHLNTAAADIAAQNDPLTDLAEQLQLEIRTRFSPADRLAFRLHLDGESYRDIAALVGVGDHSWISRRVAKMKATLREVFGAAWANLNAE